jgi:hypothetical protein
LFTRGDPMHFVQSSWGPTPTRHGTPHSRVPCTAGAAHESRSAAALSRRERVCAQRQAAGWDPRPLMNVAPSPRAAPLMTPYSLGLCYRDVPQGGSSSMWTSTRRQPGARRLRPISARARSPCYNNVRRLSL